MRRVRVLGNSGSGKTYLSTRIAAILDLPHLELDALQHRADWEPAPRDEFRAGVAAFVATSEETHAGWVVDGNYLDATDGLLDAADTHVWLDYSRWLVMSRVVRRTLWRMAVRRELWNGNRERWRNLFNPDYRENIVLWTWTQHDTYRRSYGQLSQRSSTTRWIRLRTVAQTRRWLEGLEARTS